jgi:hypothetical protein
LRISTCLLTLLSLSQSSLSFSEMQSLKRKTKPPEVRFGCTDQICCLIYPVVELERVTDIRGVVRGDTWQRPSRCTCRSVLDLIHPTSKRPGRKSILDPE